MEKYLFLIIIVIILIIIIFILYNLKKNTESFSNYSQYSKKYILDNCVNNWAQIYPQGNAEESCKSHAWVTNPEYLCGICGDNEQSPLYAFQPNNDTTLPRLFGCPPNMSNKLGLNWQQNTPVNPLSLILSDKLTCNLQNIGVISNMYLYIYAKDNCYVTLNGNQIISKSGWTSLGIFYLENISYADELSFNLVNNCESGGINICYIWNKQLFIMDKNGFENCANIIRCKASGNTGWSNQWVNDLTNPLPWMKNWLTCEYVSNCSGGSSSATISFKTGYFANQETLNNDLVGFVGIDDYGTVYHNNVEVFNKPEPWTNVMQFTIPNVNFFDTLEIQCTNASGYGGICLTYLWSGQLFTIPNNLEGFNKTANIITYTSTNLNTITYSTSGTDGNLQFVTNWINSCSGECNFSLSAYVGYNPWIYQPSNNTWFTIVPNNYVCKWSDLPIISNSQMTISFWLNLSSIYNDWRNIFHFSNQNANMGTIGNRVPGLWVQPDFYNLYLVNDLQTDENQNYINPYNISLNTPVFIAITWYNEIVISYVNGIQQQSIRYPSLIEPANSNTVFYIGDPWYPQNNGIQIYNFEISNFPLSQENINSIYNSQYSSLPNVPPPSMQCSSNYSKTTPCCNQPNNSSAINACPLIQPICKNYVFDVQWGTCTDESDNS